MRRVRTSVSASESCSAWPRCRSPVTFGGGCAIVKLSRGSSALALYSPSDSQVCCQRSSTPLGLYSGSMPPIVLPRITSSGGLFGELFGLVVGGGATRHERRLELARDRLLGDRALDHVGPRGQLEHDVEQRGLDDRAQAAGAGLARQRLVRDLPEGVLGEDELDVVVAEEALVLLRERVLWLGEDLDEILALELVHRRDDRQPADELGDQAVGEQVFRHHLRQELGRRGRVLRANVSPETDGVLADPLGNDLVEVGERATADEEDVRRVDREELLVRVLAPALRRYGGDSALEDLQQSLLDALTGDVARDR